jgi:hypothetical protein
MNSKWNTFHMWNEKNMNVRSVFIYIIQPYKTKFMGLKEKP